MNILPAAPEPGPLKLKGILLWIGLACLVVNTGQVLYDASLMHTLEPGVVWAALAALAAVVLLQLALNHQSYMRVLSNIYFGIAVIVSATVATICGTLIAQTSNQSVFFARYGFAAPAMTWLHLNDLFHSAWFSFLLVLLAAGLIGSVIARKAWRWRQIGFLLSHGGLILLFIGAAIGQMSGDRGVIHLQTGESADKYDRGNGKTASLPFKLTLNNFVVDRRQAEFRLYVVEKHNDESKIAASLDATKPGSYPIKNFGKLQLISFQAGKEEEGTSTDRKWPGDPAVQLKLVGSDGSTSDIILKAAGPSSVALGSEGTELRFAKKADDIANFVSTLAIAQEGRPVFAREVRVNQPLSYEGYNFYQASYDPKNPRYSGILVVKDPGLTIVYVAFICIFIGVVQILLLRSGRFFKGEETA